MSTRLTAPLPDTDLSGVRALTLWQPWAAYVALGGKNIENRTWRPSNGWTGTLLIHAGMSFARYPEAGDIPPGRIGREALAAAEAAARQAALTHGAIVAVARMTGAHRGDRCSVWAESGVWHWQLEEVTAIEPVPCRGQRGLWTPAAELFAAVRARTCRRPTRNPHSAGLPPAAI
jgi:hypothetical protein